MDLGSWCWCHRCKQSKESLGALCLVLDTYHEMDCQVCPCNTFCSPQPLISDEQWEILNCAESPEFCHDFLYVSDR